jgi:hypothetical protein
LPNPLVDFVKKTLELFIFASQRFQQTCQHYQKKHTRIYPEHPEAYNYEKPIQARQPPSEGHSLGTLREAEFTQAAGVNKVPRLHGQCVLH